MALTVRGPIRASNGFCPRTAEPRLTRSRWVEPSHIRMPLDGLGPVGEVLRAADGRLQPSAPYQGYQHAAHIEAPQCIEVGQIIREIDRDLKFVRITVGRFGCLAGDSDQFGLLTSVGKEAVSKPAGAARRSLGVAADNDRHRFGDGLRPTVDLLECDEAPFERRFVSRPQLAQWGDVFICPGRALLEWHSERVELFAKPTDANAQQNATPREMVQRGDLLRGQNGVVLRQDE